MKKLIKKLKCVFGHGHYYQIHKEYASGDVEWKCHYCGNKKITRNVFDW